MSFRPEGDPQRMLDLVLAYPDSQFHVVDLPYRLCSWALSDSRNVNLWEDDQGQLLGWAVAQQPFAALDYAMQPDVPDLEDRILSWGKQRWQQIANERQDKVYFFTGVRDDQPERIQRLEAHGFERDDWSLSHRVRPMTLPLPDVSLPDGYTIRPLAGASEVATYTTLHRLAFGSTNMTEDWRAQTLTMPQYRPDLDLVAIAPDQTVVGFCIGWLADVQGQRTGQIEPVGVHPNYQGLGLGHILIVENLRRMQALGAVRALIEAYSTNDVSSHLYQTLGFETVYEAQAYAMVLNG